MFPWSFFELHREAAEEPRCWQRVKLFISVVIADSDHAEFHGVCEKKRSSLLRLSRFRWQIPIVCF